MKCRCNLATFKNGQVDHVIALANGGVDEMSNKQLLCIECHREKTEVENAIGYSSDLTHSSRFNPFVLESIALDPSFQYLEFVESWWPFIGLSVSSRENGKPIGPIQAGPDEYGKWLVGSEWLPTRSLQPSNLAQLADHPKAPPEFQRMVRLWNWSKPVELRKLDGNG